MWLGKLSDEMKCTLQELLVECVTQGRQQGGGVNPVSYPAQILCLGEQILFTERCEHALQHSSLAELLIELEAQLDSYTNTEIQVCACACGITAIPTLRYRYVCVKSQHVKSPGFPASFYRSLC